MQQTSSKKITASLLRDWAIPSPKDGDKESRGRILVVAGMRMIPGAAILAATAALRAGAGKLQVAAPASVAINIAVDIPEALVMPFAESTDGAPSLDSVEVVGKYAGDADAVVLGPGMAPNEECSAFVCALVKTIDTPVVLDASALFACKREPNVVAHLKGRAILTPHTAELAGVLDESPEAIDADRERYAIETAKRFNAVVALKGASTYIADPNGDVFLNESGHVGLATSGSGDVLAGVIGGLLARGATPVQSAVWGVSLHAYAGASLAKQIGLGFLAREILAQVPHELKMLSQ